MEGKLIVAVFCLLSLMVEGYPSGAGPQACLDFIPRHNMSTAQKGSAPYTLTVSASSITAGQTVTVTLTATESGAFRGFLVQARCTNCTTSETAIVPGTFAKSAANDPTKTMNCGSGTANSMTHTDASDKTTVSFAWTAPASVDGDQGVKFRAVVVRIFDEWWQRVESSEVMFTSAGVSVPISGLLLAVTFAIWTLIN